MLSLAQIPGLPELIIVLLLLLLMSLPVLVVVVLAVLVTRGAWGEDRKDALHGDPVGEEEAATDRDETRQSDDRADDSR